MLNALYTHPRRLLLLALVASALQADQQQIIGVSWDDPADLQPLLSAGATLRFVAPSVAVFATTDPSLIPSGRRLFADTAPAGEQYFLSDHLHEEPVDWISRVYMDPRGWALWRLPQTRLLEALEHEHFLYPLPRQYAAPKPRPAGKSLARDPSPDVQQLLDLVDPQNLRDHVDRLSFVDPALGAVAGNVRTRYARRDETFASTQYLQQTLGQLLGPDAVRLDTFRVDAGDSLMYNVVAEIPGTDIDAGSYIICAHYDAIGTRSRPSDMSRIGETDTRWDWTRHPAPGADDNASGVSVVLESARILAAAGPYPWSIRFVAWSGEELGLWGSRHYANAARDRGERILGVFNFDMVGFNDQHDRLELVTNPASLWLVDLLRGSNERYNIGLQIDVLEDRFAGLSDHAPFWARGYDAVLGIENYLPTDDDSEAVRDGLYRINTQYHSVTDLPDSINWELVADVTRLTVATLAGFGREEGLPNLAVFGGDLRADDGDDLQLQIANLGPVALQDPVDVQVSRCASDSTNCQIVYDDSWTGGIPAGGAASLHIPWQRYGDAVFLMEVDPDDEIAEEIELADNRAFQTLRLIPTSSVAIFPNPFRPQRDDVLRFSGVPLFSRVRIYGPGGDLIWRGFEESETTNEIRWSGINAAGFAVASGIYVYDLRTFEGELLRRGKIAVVR